MQLGGEGSWGIKRRISSAGSTLSHRSGSFFARNKVEHFFQVAAVYLSELT